MNSSVRYEKLQQRALLVIGVTLGDAGGGQMLLQYIFHLRFLFLGGGATELKRANKV